MFVFDEQMILASLLILFPHLRVNTHVNDNYGSHQAADAAGLFSTIGLDLNLFSSEMRVNSQYMHVLWFNLKVKEPTTLSEVKEKLFNNKFISLTNKDLTSSVFSFGRDHGHFGRIMNQSVVVEKHYSRNDHEITGFVLLLKMETLFLFYFCC